MVVIQLKLLWSILEVLVGLNILVAGVVTKSVGLFEGTSISRKANR